MTEYKHEIDLSPEMESRIPGYLLVEADAGNPGKSINILHEGIRRFFGGFGRNAHLFDFGKYSFALLLPEQSQKLDCISLKRDGQDVAFIEGTFSDFDLLRKCKAEDNIIAGFLASEVLENARKNKIGRAHV